MNDTTIDFISRIGREIKLERKAQGILQRNMGELSGFGSLYISQIENAYRYKYHSNIYFKLAIALNIPLSVLVYRAMIQDSQAHLDTIKENHNNPLEFDDIPEVITYYSQKLKDERIAKGIELWKMAEKLGVSSYTLDDTERNLILTPFTRYYEYSNLLDIKLYNLIREAEDFVIKNKSNQY